MYLSLPLTETGLFLLDLLGKGQTQTFLLLLVLRVLVLLLLCLAKLAGLHLDLAVVFVVQVFGGVDQVVHMRANQEVAELLKVTVVFIFDLGTAPGVLTALDAALVSCDNIFGRANHGEGHRTHNVTVARGHALVLALNRT